MSGPSIVGEPGAHLGQPSHEVGARDLGDLLVGRRRRPERHGDRQRSRRRACGGDHARPHLGSREVDGDHVRSPAQQRAQRSHLRAGAEHDDGDPGEVEPVRVVEHRVHRGGEPALDDPLVHPGVELAPYVDGEEPLPVERHREARVPPGTAVDGHRGVRRLRPPVARLQERHLRAVAPEHRALVERGETRAGHGVGRVGCTGPCHDQVAVGRQVVAAPLADRGAAGGGVRIDCAERRPDDSLRDRGGADAPVRACSEVDAVVVIGHAWIQPGPRRRWRQLSGTSPPAGRRPAPPRRRAPAPA